MEAQQNGHTSLHSDLYGSFKGNSYRFVHTPERQYIYTYRQTNRQTTDGQAGILKVDRQTDRQADRQTDRQTGGQADRQTGRQTDKQAGR
jgi:hypothetical protein